MACRAEDLGHPAQERHHSNMVANRKQNARKGSSFDNARWLVIDCANVAEAANMLARPPACELASTYITTLSME